MPGMSVPVTMWCGNFYLKGWQPQTAKQTRSLRIIVGKKVIEIIDDGTT